MAHAWTVALNLLYPVPLFLLFLLHIPKYLSVQYEISIRKIAINMTDNILFYKITFPGNIKLSLHSVAVISSAFAFFISVLGMVWISAKKSQIGSGHDLNEKYIRWVTAKWRVEKNVLLSLLSMVLWLSLHRIRMLMKELEHLSAGYQK
eukprot:gene2597-5077_t